MADRDPDQNNPLSPIYPSKTPTVPGNGRKWFALLIIGTMVLATLAWAVSLVL